MIKIFLTVRNRLEITKKCIHALKQHSKIPHSIYVYDNASNYLVENHFAYFCKMYIKGYIDQICFTTETSTFNAFSKASTCNFFGHQHEQDPKKNKYEFLVILDNDIIVTPEWDLKLREAWKYVIKNKMTDIKVIGQRPGGIKMMTPIKYQISDDMIGRVGKLGGSGLWSVRNDFFRDVGFLDLNRLVNHDKKHDQLYWIEMNRAARGNPYIMGLNQKLGIHCGKQAGSVCNVLTRNRGVEKAEKIKFEHAEEKLSKMSFEEFYKSIYNDKQLTGDW
ncbi:MAG TPA: hypothetical protein VMX17_08630 [Candidatus Glassbacteria bacterium]|nr:hypothetical protein [Candidatus Glassbacteria bacterium]